MGKQTAGRPVPPVPSGRATPPPARPAPTAEGHPVSPAVARSRSGPAAAQGHGQSGK
jgi:hypothetical protein